jgi:hypothetical protein
MPSKQARVKVTSSQVKKLSAEQKRTVMKNIFQTRLGINVFTGSPLNNFILHEFKPGKKSPFTLIVEDYSQETEARGLAINIIAAINRQCRDNPVENQEILKIADMLEDKLLPLLDILNIEDQFEKTRENLADFIDSTIDSLVSKGVPDNSIHILRLYNIKHNLADITNMQAVGQVLHAGGQILRMNDAIKIGAIIKKIAPHAMLINSEKSSIDVIINSSFTTLYHIGEGLENRGITKIGSILRNAHWLTMLDLHKSTSNESLSDILHNMDLQLGERTMQLLQQQLDDNNISKSQAIDIFSLIQTSPINEQLITNTIQIQKVAAASALVANIAKQINCIALSRVAQAALCVASVQQFYSEAHLLTNGPGKLTALSQTTGVILAACGEFTGNRTIEQIGHSILTGVGTYAALAAIPGGAFVALPMAALTVLGNFFANKNSKKQRQREAERIKTEQQILAYVKDSHAAIIATFNEMQVKFAQVFNTIEHSHNLIMHTINESAKKINIQFQELNKSLDHTRNEIHFTQHIINSNFAAIALQDINKQISMHESMASIDSVNAEVAEKIFLEMHNWLMSKNIDFTKQINGYNLVNNNTSEQKYLILYNLMQSAANNFKDYSNFSILGGITAFMQADGFTSNLDLSDITNIPIWFKVVNAVHDILEKFKDQFSTRMNLKAVYQNLGQANEDIKSNLLKLATQHELINFLTSKVTHHYATLIQKIDQLQFGKVDALQDFTTIKESFFTQSELKKLLANCTKCIPLPCNQNFSLPCDLASIFFKWVYPQIAADIGITAHLHSIRGVMEPADNYGRNSFVRYAENHNYNNPAHTMIIAYRFFITVQGQETQFATVQATCQTNTDKNVRHRLFRAIFQGDFFASDTINYTCVLSDGTLQYVNNGKVLRSENLVLKTHIEPTAIGEFWAGIEQSIQLQADSSFITTINSSTNLPSEQQIIANRDKNIIHSLYHQRTAIAEVIAQNIHGNEELLKAGLYSKILNVILALRGSNFNVADLHDEFTRLIGELACDKDASTNFRQLIAKLRPATYAEIIHEPIQEELHEILKQLSENLTYYKSFTDSETISNESLARAAELLFS